VRSLQIFVLTVIFVALHAIISCKKDTNIPLTFEQPIMQIPEGFPTMTFPEGNEYNYQRWLLGKRLFYDPIMSRQNTVSCASCHIAGNAFSDTLPLSKGDNNLLSSSNAPTLTNIGYNPYFTRAGGVPTLEMQILVPIQEHNEFNTNILAIVELLKKDSSYVHQAKIAYNRELDPFVITRSIANFESSLISGNSIYDQYTYQNKKAAMNESAKKGMALFFGDKTNCSKCHSGFNFSNYAFENNGLYTNYADSGRMRLTKDETDRARFKVPTLRNIEFTAPYMHDGSIQDLEGVVMHYNSGGVFHKNKSTLVKPLGLSSQEQKNLVDFLKSLTDYSFINNKNFRQ
jgi:cytochrome c peroxidase